MSTWQKPEKKEMTSRTIGRVADGSKDKLRVPSHGLCNFNTYHRAMLHSVKYIYLAFVHLLRNISIGASGN